MIKEIGKEIKGDPKSNKVAHEIKLSKEIIKQNIFIALQITNIIQIVVC